tara:strand:+ start:382 stop:750 length:369 start_codon:yes stop_codon:yes gene_type:complete
MIWEKIKNDITKEKPSSFYNITNREYMEKWLRAVSHDWITKSSQITFKGYSIYVATCLCLNKTSLLGGPLVKSKAPAVTYDLMYYEIVKLDQEKNEYVLDWQGPGYIKVIVNCIRGHGDPKV